MDRDEVQMPPAFLCQGLVLLVHIGPCQLADAPQSHALGHEDLGHQAAKGKQTRERLILCFHHYRWDVIAGKMKQTLAAKLFGLSQ